MRPAPPKAIETLVGLLIPPACREDVLGDLHERYTCPRQYIVEAACTAPLVIVSGILRTMDTKRFVMEALALYTSFLAAALQLDRTFLYEQSGFLRLAIPSAVALVALMLGDAYGNPRKRSTGKPILEAALGVGFALLSQAPLFMTSSELVVPRWIMISGAGMGLLLVWTLRMLFPPGATRAAP